MGLATRDHALYGTRLRALWGCGRVLASCHDRWGDPRSVEHEVPSHMGDPLPSSGVIGPGRPCPNARETVGARPRPAGRWPR
jgi:hypothetical protein